MHQCVVWVVVAVAFVKSDRKVHRHVVGMTLPIGMLQRPNKIVGVKYPPSVPPKLILCLVPGGS